MFNESIFRKQRKKKQIIRYIFWVKRSCGVRGIFSLNCVLIEFTVLYLIIFFSFRNLHKHRLNRFYQGYLSLEKLGFKFIKAFWCTNNTYTVCDIHLNNTENNKIFILSNKQN